MSGEIKLKNIKFVFLAISKIRNWPSYLTDLFNLTKKKLIVYKLRDGTKFQLRARTSDRGILTSVVLLDEYRINSTDLPRDATIIDIGGQTGMLSVFASRKASKVYTYEPIKENYEFIKKNIALNGLKNKITVFNMAVSDKKKKLKIYISADNTGGHSAYGKGKYETVIAIPFQSVFEDNDIKRCDLLKLDAEGSEYEILYNLPSQYFNRIKRIYMEYHDIDSKDRNHKTLVKFLKAKKYSVEYDAGLLYAIRK